MPLKRTNSRISKTTAVLTILAIIIFVVVTSNALKRSAERHHMKKPTSQNYQPLQSDKR